MARPYAEDFGRALRRAYERANLSQVDLAEALRNRGWVKVDQSLVSKWARGLLVPPLDILPDIDAACGEAKGYVLELAGYVDAEALVGRRREAPLTSRRRGRRPAATADKPAV